MSHDVEADDSTLGGYIARHARPPAFEGKDGNAYTVDIAIDETGDPSAPFGGYLLFVKWEAPAPGQTPVVRGHVESEFVARGKDEASVQTAIDRMTLQDVKQTLDAVIHTE